MVTPLPPVSSPSCVQSVNRQEIGGVFSGENNESKRKELKLMAFKGFPTKHFPPDHPTGKPKSEKFPPMHTELPNKDFKVSLLNMNKQLRIISYLRNTCNMKDRGIELPDSNPRREKTGEGCLQNSEGVISILEFHVQSHRY